MSTEPIAAAPGNWPEATYGILCATYALLGQAQAAIEALPDAPAAARNLFAALMENRACLAALETPVSVAEAAYRAGCEDTERALAARSRPRLHAV